MAPNSPLGGGGGGFKGKERASLPFITQSQGGRGLKVWRSEKRKVADKRDVWAVAFQLAGGRIRQKKEKENFSKLEESSKTIAARRKGNLGSRKSGEKNTYWLKAWGEER